MKRVAATIFLLVYFVTSSGATIQLHYCMDKLVSWSLNSKSKSNCSKCGMEKKGHKGCCHDESKFVKLDKVHKASANYFDFSKFQIQISKATFDCTEHLYVSNPVLSYPTTNAPPLISKAPIYLFNSVFRI